MTDYVVLVPFLDECGGVYLPGLGENGSATRLNPRATAIWRRVANGHGLDQDKIEPGDAAFVSDLLAMGVIRRRESEDG